jgi:hypothetical protein
MSTRTIHLALAEWIGASHGGYNVARQTCKTLDRSKIREDINCTSLLTLARHRTSNCASMNQDTSSEIVMAEPLTNGTHESQSGSDTYASIKKGTYALKRDFNASTRYRGKKTGTPAPTDQHASRLTAQHYLWKDALQFDLHPDIPVGPNARVADVATGNGFVSCNPPR